MSKKRVLSSSSSGDQYARFCREPLAQLGAKRAGGRINPPCAEEGRELASAGEG